MVTQVIWPYYCAVTPVWQAMSCHHILYVKRYIHGEDMSVFIVV